MSVLAALLIQVPIQVLTRWWRIEVAIRDIKAGMAELDREMAQLKSRMDIIEREVAQMEDILREEVIDLADCSLKKPVWWDWVVHLP